VTAIAWTRAAGAATTAGRWAMAWEARGLFVVTCGLLAFGLATLYSASAYVALQDGLGSAYFVVKQVQGALVGLLACMALAKWDADRLERWAWPLMALALLTMLLTVLPFTTAIAPRINGSRRFLLGASLQPSEFAKLAVITWAAMVTVKKGDQLRRLTKGPLPVLVVVGALCVLAALEPDVSAALMFAMLAGVVLFAGGARVGHFVFLGVVALPLVWGEVHRLGYVAQRLAGFRGEAVADPGSLQQATQSLIAVGSGGLLGVGFGEGRQQYGFVPLQYNDFIGSNVGEEWGFVGLAALLVAYALYVWLGVRIARQARTPFLRLVALGITFTLGITAYLHLGVVTGLLPTTGLTLPFVSYGRSNLVLSLAMTGILLNIGSTREPRTVG
jgi:cell division protein FtsW